jgi:hypothetical protein
MPGTTYWFGCFTGPERQVSKTNRIQYCLLSQPLLYLFTQLPGKPHNVCLTGWLQPVLNKERLLIASPVFKLLLCRCDEASNASRLGNNEISLMNQIDLNNVTKNRTLIYPSQANLITQRTTADAGMVHGFIWNKEEQGAGADV